MSLFIDSNFAPIAPVLITMHPIAHTMSRVKWMIAVNDQRTVCLSWAHVHKLAPSKACTSMAP